MKMSKAKDFLKNSVLSEGKWDGHLKGVTLNAGAKRLIDITGEFIVSAVPMRKLGHISFAFDSKVKVLGPTELKAMADGDGKLHLGSRFEVVFPCKFEKED